MEKFNSACAICLAKEDCVVEHAILACRHLERNCCARCLGVVCGTRNCLAVNCKVDKKKAKSVCQKCFMPWETADAYKHLDGAHQCPGSLVFEFVAAIFKWRRGSFPVEIQDDQFVSWCFSRHSDGLLNVAMFFVECMLAKEQ